MPAPDWPMTTTRSPPTTSSARQRSPSLRTVSIRPRTVTRRHSCGIARGRRRARPGPGPPADPRRLTVVGREPRRAVGAADLPSTRSRVPTGGAAVSGSRTSIAPVASWTTIRRPRRVEQRRRRGHDRRRSRPSGPIMPRAWAIETTPWSASASGLGDRAARWLRRRAGPGDPLGLGSGPAVRTMSARSRTQRR